MLLLNIIKFLLRKTVKVMTNNVFPEYQTPGSACFDIAVSELKLVKPKELYNLHTDLRVEIPEGWCLLVFSRSSLGQKKCIIPNSVGVIDSDYRGEIKIPILNLSDEEVLFEKGQRVAQGLLVRANQCDLYRVYELSHTDRDLGGFGSTGI